MRNFARRDTEHDDAVDRLTAWTRARFALGEESAVLVSEIACTRPGCPPLETVVAFWTEPERRHSFRVFKRIVEVTEDDVPPSWLKASLEEIPGSELDCC